MLEKEKPIGWEMEDTYYIAPEFLDVKKLYVNAQKNMKRKR